MFKKNIDLKFILLGIWILFNLEIVRFMIGELIIFLSICKINYCLFKFNYLNLVGNIVLILINLLKSINFCFF